MCRNIKQLRRSEQAPTQAPTDEEIRDAALQFVRKVSGYRKPSKANQVVFGAIDQLPSPIFKVEVQGAAIGQMRNVAGDTVNGDVLLGSNVEAVKSDISVRGNVVQ